MKYINKTKWNKVREEVLKRDYFACVRCGETKNLDVDHIVPRDFGEVGEERLLDMNNLQTLCKECHQNKQKEEYYLKNRLTIALKREEEDILDDFTGKQKAKQFYFNTLHFEKVMGGGG